MLSYIVATIQMTHIGAPDIVHNFTDSGGAFMRGKAEPVPELWHTRDEPVLLKAVRLINGATEQEKVRQSSGFAHQCQWW